MSDNELTGWPYEPQADDAQRAEEEQAQREYWEQVSEAMAVAVYALADSGVQGGDDIAIVLCDALNIEPMPVFQRAKELAVAVRLGRMPTPVKH